MPKKDGTLRLGIHLVFLFLFFFFNTGIMDLGASLL